MLDGRGRKPKGLLDVHQYRAISGERMILVPGPAAEVRTVRRIFRLFTEERISPQAIADPLNDEGKLTSQGRNWSSDNVSALLRNERYIGTHTYNARSPKLKKEPRLLNAKSEWVRTPGAFEAIVSEGVFAKAQEVIAQQRHRQHTEESLLERLRYLLDRHGYLSVARRCAALV